MTQKLRTLVIYWEDRFRKESRHQVGKVDSGKIILEIPVTLGGLSNETWEEITLLSWLSLIDGPANCKTRSEESLKAEPRPKEVERPGHCPLCGSESIYLEKQTTQPEVLTPDGPAVVQKQHCRCRTCGGSFSPSGP